jgi:hypothetical protein
MKQIIAILGLVIFLQGCSTASVDRNKADTNKKNETLLPSETKLTSSVKLSQGQKAARKPYNFVIVDYMNVVEGQEDNYLKAEAVWQKIHQDLAEQGRILGWGLAKARENKLGMEFITWKIVHSREDVVDLYNMDKFKKLLSEVDFKTLQELTGSSRSISGSEVLSLTDYTLPQEGNSFGELDPAVLAFNWNFMTPTSGREAEYLDVEQRYAQPWSQAKTDLDPRFIGWDLQEVVSAQGQTHPSKIRTVDVLRKDQKLSNPDRLAINNKINNLGIWPQNINVGAMRKMERVTFDVIYRTELSKNGVAKLWEALEGSWTAEQGQGYRTKTITRYNEKIQFFNREGELQGGGNSPISVEFVKQIPQFTVYKQNGSAAFSIPFEIKDNIWFEYAGSANDNWSTFRYSKGTDSPYTK